MFHPDRLWRTGEWKELSLIEWDGLTLAGASPSRSLAVQWMPEGDVNSHPYPGNAVTTVQAWLDGGAWGPCSKQIHRALGEKLNAPVTGKTSRDFDPDLLSRLLKAVDDDHVMIRLAPGGIVVIGDSWFAWVGRRDKEQFTKFKRLVNKMQKKEPGKRKHDILMAAMATARAEKTTKGTPPQSA